MFNSLLKIGLGLGLQINIQDAPHPPSVKSEFIFYLTTVGRRLSAMLDLPSG